MSNVKDTYAKFVRLSQEMAQLGSASRIVDWDMEVIMPEEAGDERAKVSACLAGIQHEKATAPEYADCLHELKDSVGSDELNGVETMNVLRALESYEHDLKLPVELVREFTATTSAAHHVWAKAKQTGDFEAFRPSLEHIVELSRQRGRLFNASSPYSGLIDEYEPGATTSSVEAVFNPMRDALQDLLARIVASKHAPDPAYAKIAASQARQEMLCRDIAKGLGFDFKRGRLDASAHPFSNRLHPHDQRITTRYDEQDALSAIYSTIHEVGHSLYEGGVPQEHFGLAAGEASSYGMHEANSRLWENLVGRSRPFCEHLMTHLSAVPFSQVTDVEQLYRSMNIVQPSLIRTEADEVTYGLHIVLRFEIERDLIEGRLEVKDVPEAWDAKMQQMFGIRPADHGEGCMQDVHWSCGMFGYFPSYALGNIYNAQLYEEAKRNIPQLEERFAHGEFETLRSWLSEHVWRHGFTLDAGHIVRAVTKTDPSAKDFIDYLERKYTEIYRL